MKTGPILMSAPMVRATLAGTKTQTRRALKQQPLDVLPMQGDKAGREWVILEQRAPEPKGKVIRCRFGVPGDLLWVREAWAQPTSLDPGPVFYRADYPACVPRHFENVPPADEITWKPSIHMARTSSRITLRLTDVRVERLQNISEVDARAEGVESLDSRAHEDREQPDFDSALCGRCGGLRLHNGLGANGGVRLDIDCTACDTHAKRFQWLWESINGQESWTANPWIWALTFEPVVANIDAVLRRAAA